MIPFEIRTLKKPHTEKWRAQRHRWCVEHQWIFASFKDVYYQSFQQHVHYGSVALCAFGNSVILFLLFHLRALPLSVCLLYAIGLLYHSKFRKNQLSVPSLPIPLAYYRSFVSKFLYISFRVLCLKRAKKRFFSFLCN